MGLRYFINNLTGQLEDGRGERILPKPKPERPVADQYQDYKQVQDIFEPRTQMYIEKEMGFDEGGRVKFGSGTPFAITPSQLAKIHKLIQNTDLSLKEIGQQIGYGTDKKPMDSTSKIFKEYVKKYGEPDKMRLQRRGVKLTKNSPYVKNVIKSVEEVGVRETARRFGKERKTIRNVLHRFRKDLIKDINVKGEETSAKKSKIKAKEDIKISQKKAGPKTTKQTKEVISKIAEYNNPYKKMSAKNLAKDKNFLKRLRMHIDINTGAITYDGYTKARPVKGKVFTDLELADHAIKKAKQGQLFTDDHIIPKSLKKQNVGYPINFQPATYIENSNFDNARKYVLNKPEGDTSAIDKYLTKNNQTLRFPDQKIKLGYKGPIVFDSTTGSHTLVKKPTDTKPTILSKIKKAPIPNKIKGPLLAAIGTAGAIKGADLFTGSAMADTGVQQADSVLPEMAAGAGAVGAYKARKPIWKGIKTAGKIAGKVLAPLAVPLEAGFVLSDLKSGSSVPEALLDVVMLGGLERQRQKRNFIKNKYGNEVYSQLQSYKSFGDDGMGIPQELPERFKKIEAEANQFLQAQRAERAEEFERRSNMPMPEIDAFAASNGGIASLTRTTPPTRGPQHMGLASFKKRGR
jgi:transposase